MSSLKSYVNDSKLFLSFPVEKADTAAAQLTHDLREVTAWCCSNSLLINPDKTKLLLLGTPQMLANIPNNFEVTPLGKDTTITFSKGFGDSPGFASDVQ